MEINQMQKEADSIISLIDKKLQTSHNAEVTFTHLIEEFGELAKQHNNKVIRKVKQDMSNIEEEIADISRLLMRLANIYGVDIEKAMLNKIQGLKKRHNIQ